MWPTLDLGERTGSTLQTRESEVRRRRCCRRSWWLPWGSFRPGGDEKLGSWRFGVWILFCEIRTSVFSHSSLSLISLPFLDHRRSRLRWFSCFVTLCLLRSTLLTSDRRKLQSWTLIRPVSRVGTPVEGIIVFPPLRPVYWIAGLGCLVHKKSWLSKELNL